MSEWATIERRRVVSVEVADALVGTPVEPRALSALNAIEVLTEPTVVVDPDLGEPVFASLPLPPDWTERLRAAVLAIDSFTGLARAGGLRAKAQTFGMAPRRPALKRDACRITQLARDRPDVHNVLEALAGHLADTLRSFAPEIEARDRALIDSKVTDEWRLGDAALWTSGVVNHTCQLPYHRDGMNFDAWSAMPVVRSGVSGGALHVPEYGLASACRDGYAIYFNGHRHVHGVTPFSTTRGRRLGTPEAYRFSVVYYALRGMTDCATHAVEQARGRVKRTEREDYQRRVVRGEAEWSGGSSR